MKPILLIIEGMDRSGKTTLINYINKKNNFLHLILDRGPIGYKTYCALLDKEQKPEDYDKLEKQLLQVEHLCIYLYADKKVIKQRFIETEEKPVHKGILANLNIYTCYYVESKLNKIAFDTGIMTTEEIFLAIENKLKDK